MLALLVVPAVAYAAEGDAIADGPTINSWNGYVEENNTQTVGRIWTDKTVSAGNIELTGGTAAGINVPKADNADFLVGLSALSSTSNLTSTLGKPLDIVLLLDTSGSMDDNFGYRQTKLDALKSAANSFIDKTADENKGISDNNSKHRISVVSYASDASRRTELTSNASDLKAAINSLRANGSTGVDYGLEEVQQVLNGARDNAQKIVIVFTDGEPNHYSGFDNEVAAEAVNIAKNIKDGGALVYSIGVFQDAEPSDTSDGFNKYMHGMSSNYPTATAEGDNGGIFGWGAYFNVTFGAPAEKQGYYKAAEDADQLNNIFNEIFDEIKTPGSSPTEVEEGFQGAGGYITFTDTLGNYMEVKGDQMTVVFASQKFDGTRQDDGSFAFTGSVEGNPVYGSANLADLKVTVEPGKDGAGDTVTVKIPASLIPLRNYVLDIDENGNTTMSTTSAFPIRVFYNVGLRDGVKDVIANPDEAMKQYISKNTAEDGTVSFYSNEWDREDKTAGATAEFTPASTNKFYYFTENTPLYTDEACATRATASDIQSGSGNVYYKNDYYKQVGEKGELVKSSIAIPVTAFASAHADNWSSDSEGAYMKAGVPRLNRTNDFNVEKGSDEASSNVTGTATKYISPAWVGEKDIKVSLGNNGKRSVERPATLAVSKTVAAADGFDGNLENYQQKDFTFNFTFTNVPDDFYQAEVKDASGNVVDNPFTLSVKNSAATHTLKHGETLYVYGLPAGATYTVAEDLTATPGFTSQVTNGAAEGTFAAGRTAAVEFTNTYEAASVDLDAGIIGVKKNFTDREWRGTDEFAFGIGPNNLPAFQNAKVTITKDTPEYKASFGKVTFDKPDTYTYYIWEYNPENAEAGIADIPGVNYSGAQYQVVIKVEDNGAGELAIASTTMTQTHNDAGQPLAEPVAVEGKVAAFTNTYSAQDTTARIGATKNYTDNSNGNPLADSMFEVTLTPTGGYKTDSGSTASTVLPENVPMPKDEAGEILDTFTNTDEQFVIPTIQFDSENVGYTYTYTLSEVNKGAEGMAYDKTTHTITITVTEEEDGGVAVIKATVSPANVEFTNTYDPADATLSGDAAIKGTKTLTGRDAKDETFTFTLKPAASNTLDGVTGITADGLTATVEGQGAVSEAPFSFGDITFSKTGTYEFEMKEVVPEADADGMTWDRHTCTVTVDVTLDKETGALKAVPSYSTNGEAAGNAFTNVYTASMDYGTEAGGIVVSKVLNGRTMEPNEFSFAIAGDEGRLAEADKSFSNPERRADGVAIEMNKLQSLTFDQNDAGKTFNFTVSETEGDASGVIYDATEYVIGIEVIDNGDGTMHTLTSVTKYANGVAAGNGEVVFDKVDSAAEGYIAPVLPFANAYQPGDVTIDSEAENALAVTKQVEGAPATEAFNFNLKLTDGNASAVFEGSGEGKTAFDGISVSTKDNLADGESQTLKFGDITFTNKGTYTFKVVETNQAAENSGWTYDNEPKTITVVVTDKTEDGSYADTLRIESVTGNNPVVTNKYAAALVVIGGEGAEQSLTVQKTVAGRDNAEDFSFTLSPVDVDDPKWGNVEAVADFKETVNITDDFKAGDFKRATWGAISFNAVGTYEFTVKEDQGGDDVANGWKYDNHTATIVVTVTDENFDGQLDASIEYKNDAAEVDADKQVTDAAAFTNRYAAGANDGVTWNTSLTKVFTGKAWEDEEFEFAIEADSAKTPDGAAINPIPMPAEGTKMVGAPEDGGNTAMFDFGNITFTTPGTYIYKVTETKGDLPGVTYDGGTATVTVEVSDNGAGKLIAVAAVANGEFTNEYKSSLDYNAKGGLTLVKNLDGRSIAADQFSFEVAPTNDDAKAKTGAEAKTITVPAAPMNEETGVATSTASVFDSLVFNEADAGKTFTYTVKENGTAPTGYTYDGTTYTVSIEVVDDGKGVMTVTTTVSADGKEDVAYTYTVADEDAPRAEVVFNNAYDATGSIPATGEGALKARKELTGRDLVSGEFTFTVKDDKGNQVATGANDANGAISFGEISYSIDSLKDMVAQGIAEVTDENGVATYAIDYTVAEDTAGLAEAGVTANVSSFSITVNVVDNGSGTLAVSIDYGNVGSELVFENTYGAKDASLTVKGQKVVKGVEGKDLNVPALKDGEFTFTLSGEAGAPMPENATAQNDSAGNVEFGPITYTLENVWPEDVAADNGDEGGVEALSDPAGEPRAKTFTYTVAESGYMPGVKNENGVKTFTVTVTDDGKGNLTAVPNPSEGAAFTFTNIYDVTETSSSPTDGAVTVAKSLAGRDLQAGEFEFTMTDQMTGEVVATAKNEADGTVRFPAIPFSEQGTHTYTIAETDNKLGGVTYDPATYTATATVTDDGQGNLNVAWTVTRGEEQVKEIVFENTYEAAPTSIVFNAKKELVGRELKEGEFTFELRENGEVVGTATNDAEGKVVFEAVPYTEVGSHTYEIAEVKGSDSTITYDDAVYTVTVNVTDRDDSGAATGKLSAADWSYGENGAPVFENTYTAPEEPKPLPSADDAGDGNTLVKTGDAAPTALLAGGALAAAAVVCGAMLRLRRSRRDER